MTEPREPTLKHWKRRAIKAEETVAMLQRIRATEARFESEMVHELAAARVVLCEIEDALNTLKTIAASALQTSAGSQFQGKP